MKVLRLLKPINVGHKRQRNAGEILQPHEYNDAEQLIQGGTAEWDEVDEEQQETSIVHLEMDEKLNSKRTEPAQYEPKLTAEMVQLLIRAQERKEARGQTAEDIICQYNIKTLRDTGQMLYYKDGYYQHNAETVVREGIRNLWGYSTTKHDISEIIEAHIKPQTYVDRERFNDGIYLLSLSNGILNLLTGELRDHSPVYEFTYQIPVKYDPSATCPTIDDFLPQVTDPSNIPLIHEIFGYCLWRGYPTAKIPVFIGSGRNAKSTLLTLLKNFIGPENVRSLTIQELEHDTFAKSLLYGMHANINPDIGHQEITTSGAIKSLTGGDPIDANVKHHAHIRYVNFAKLIWGTNDLPQADDTTLAWNSRWMFIKFPHVFKPNTICPECHIQHDIIPDLGEKLSAETSGLLNHALNGLQRLRENNWQFSMSEDVCSMQNDYHILSDPVAGFVRERISVAPGETTKKGDIYNQYLIFCRELGTQPLASNQFSMRLQQHVPELASRKSSSIRKWVGIRLRDDTEQVEFDNPNGGVSPESLRRGY